MKTFGLSSLSSFEIVLNKKTYVVLFMTTKNMYMMFGYPLLCAILLLCF